MMIKMVSMSILSMCCFRLIVGFVTSYLGKQPLFVKSISHRASNMIKQMPHNAAHKVAGWPNHTTARSFFGQAVFYGRS